MVLVLFGSECLLSGCTSNLPDTLLIRPPISGETWFEIAVFGFSSLQI